MLPTLSLPKYNLTLSTGKTIQFRSFVVREEKVLLIAQQSGSLSDTLQAMKDIVKTCVLSTIDVESMPILDFLWILINIRMKSIGEATKFRIICRNTECKKGIDTTYDMSTVVLPDTTGFIKKKINITDNIGIILRPPTVKIASIALDTKLDAVNKQYAGYADCIDAVFDGEEMHRRPDVSETEIQEFVESFTPEQMGEVKKFFDGCPKIAKDIDIVCPHCGAKSVITLKGIFDFFV